MTRLRKLLEDRCENAPAESYTRRLFESDEMLSAKILEEAQELVDAASPDELVHEAADVVFFTMTKLVKNRIDWWEVEKELDRRALKVTRRGGQVKGVSQ